MNEDAPKVGDIYYESWGYDQTQNDFCQVVKLSPSGKTVICRMMGKTTTEGGASVIPTEAYGVEFRLKVDVWIDRHDGRYRGTYLRGSYPFIERGPVDRNPNDPFDKWRHYEAGPGGDWFTEYRGPVSFSRFKGEPVYETPAGMGH